MKLKRIFKHLLTFQYFVKKKFHKLELNNFEKLISVSEKKHLGQIKFVVEYNLNLFQLLHNVTSKERAKYWFSTLNVWDTELNTGILVYILYADKKVEILADRGLSICNLNSLQEICEIIIDKFKKEEYMEGLRLGLVKIDKLLVENFPRNNKKYIDEISNEILFK